jgi:hypothetical protein
MRLIWLAIARFEGSTVISGETIVTEFLSDLTTPGIPYQRERPALASPLGAWEPE